VLLVLLGGRASAAAVRRTRELATPEGPVAVLALLKIHGYSLGMPNPGLLPTTQEKAAQRDVVADAITRLEKKGCDVDGQVAATRHPARTIAWVARHRGVHHVVIERVPTSSLRRAVEGDTVASVRRRLGDSVEVVVLDAVATGAGPSVGAAPRPRP
jgi:hypothetical protein